MTDLLNTESSKKIKLDLDCNKNGDEIQALNSELLKEADDALQKSNRIHVRPVVDETKLGIELFIGDQKDQFHGLIKSRYADFIVHEIDPDGNIARLTNLEPPEEREPTCPMSIRDLVDEEALNCLSEVNNGYLNEYRIDVSGLDKDSRTSLHHALRNSFDRLESTTVSESDKPKEDKKKGDLTEESSVNLDVSEKPDVTPKDTAAQQTDEKRYILVTRRNKISRPKNLWPRNRPDYTHFILYKENRDTMDAIHALASAVNVKPSTFSSAGVKDRRAVTSQWLSAWRLEPKRLLNAIKKFNKRPFIKVGNFCFKKEQIKLGHLSSNKFDIVIRHLVHNGEGLKVIEDAMISIKEKGFINYFGLQRFGSRSTQTHEIGLAILQSKWSEAVDLILSYRYDDKITTATDDRSVNNEPDLNSNQVNENRKINRNRQDNKRWSNGAEDHNNFIDLWKTKKDADIIFKKYPQFRFTNEGTIMRALSKSTDSSTDYLGALTSLPRTVRSMYVHSYQSLLWNRMTTFRLRTHGYKVVQGDLVLAKDSNISDNSLDMLLSADEVDTVDNGSNKNDEEFNGNGNQNRKIPIEDIDSKIVVVTPENVDKFTIFDVVLPLVGSRVRLPENDVGKEFERILKEDNLTQESFKAREKLFISYGSYRKIMVRPKNVQWSIEQYSDPQQNLVQTDLDILFQATQTKEFEGSQKPRSPPKSDSSDEALVVTFELPPSSYATMCLREIMKTRHDVNNKF